MSRLVLVLLMLVIFGLIFYLAERSELKKFQTTTYTWKSEKLSQNMTLLIASDLHNHIYGEDNAPLLQAMRDANPDLILVPGDLFTEEKDADTSVALRFLEEAVMIAPVYYSNGNHETRIQRTAEGMAIWEDYKEKAEAMGVHFVNNCSESLLCQGNPLEISGYEADMKFYAKGKPIVMEEGEVKEQVSSSHDPDQFHILLAHNPVYFEAYKAFDADLTVSGHMHGGLVRIPGIGSVISPQFKLFPKYDAGHFEEDGHHLVISKGLGTHTFNIRVFNRAELVVVKLESEV